MRLRRGSDPDPHKNAPFRPWGRFPAGDIVAELERAYAFFNERFFVSGLDDRPPSPNPSDSWGREQPKRRLLPASMAAGRPDGRTHRPVSASPGARPRRPW